MTLPLINFGAGPAKLPQEVLLQAQREFVVYPPAGISVMEISHRSKHFKEIITETEGLIRELMSVPSSYEVLFLQGGGTGQFAGVPLNIRAFSPSNVATYAVTGTWSDKAAKEAARYVTVHRAIHPPLKHYTHVPELSTWSIHDESAYIYYCANETVHGVEFPFVPSHKDIPVVADISSTILSGPFDIAKHGIVLGGVQKNLGPAGLTLCVVRRDLETRPDALCPSILSYKELIAAGSIYNTPPVYGIYMTKLVLEWIKRQGGVQTMAERNAAKSKLIYDIIDDSDGFYRCPVEVGSRSRMNIPFRVGVGEDVEAAFLQQAEAHGMLSLKGHRSVGGIRASLYNAITMEETTRLADFMRDFRFRQNNNP